MTRGLGQVLLYVELALVVVHLVIFRLGLFRLEAGAFDKIGGDPLLAALVEVLVTPEAADAVEQVFAGFGAALRTSRNRVQWRQGSCGADQILGDRPRLLARPSNFFIAGVVLEHEE